MANIRRPLRQYIVKCVLNLNLKVKLLIVVEAVYLQRVGLSSVYYPPIQTPQAVISTSSFVNYAGRHLFGYGTSVIAVLGVSFSIERGEPIRSWIDSFDL